MAANIGDTFQDKLQFLRGVSQEEDAFKAQSAYTQALVELEADKLDSLARFVMCECGGSSGLEEHFDHFVEAFYGIKQEDYKLEDDQIKRIDARLLKRVGEQGGAFQKVPEERREDAINKVNGRLDRFLVELNDINLINSAQKAKDVAAEWFGGARSVDTDHASHLKRLVQVITDAPEDIALVKDVMTRLRAEQVVQFRANGFLFRQVGLPQQEGLDEASDKVEVKVPYGRRAWDAFKGREANGAFINGSQLPGVLTHGEDLDTHARAIALDHFDDPVVITVNVPQDTMIDGRIFSAYVGAFTDEAVEEVALGEVNKLPRVDIKPLYAGMGDEQVTRLETLLFGEKVPTRRPTQQSPKPTDKPDESNNWGKIFKAAAVLVIGYFVVIRLWPKVSEWMNEKSVTDLTNK